jgi:hypothetical protein
MIRARFRRVLASALYFLAAVGITLVAAPGHAAGRTTIVAPLPEPLGACCMPDGGCEILEEASCYESDGMSWTEGVDCANACPLPGGCCLYDGTCADLLQAACEDSIGEFFGVGAPCARAVCRIAVGKCFQPPNAQRPIGNDWAYAYCCWVAYPNFTWCDRCRRADCPGNPPRRKWQYTQVVETIGQGACCRPDGLCMVMPRPACEALGGSFQGTETVCDASYCEDPPLGLCCHAATGCEILDFNDCVVDGGTTWTAFAACDDPGCPPTGACCFDDGICALLIQEACDDLGGRFQGEGAPCDPLPCAPVPIETRSWGGIRALFR